jgi:hypothetical protein
MRDELVEKSYCSCEYINIIITQHNIFLSFLGDLAIVQI